MRLSSYFWYIVSCNAIQEVRGLIPIIFAKVRITGVADGLLISYKLSPLTGYSWRLLRARR
jgi:hypothetical protein